MSCRWSVVPWRMAAVAACLLTISSVAPVSANDKYASLVVDANTGAVLKSSSANSLRYPASLTKIMTLYIVFEELEAGRLKRTDAIKFSKHAASQPPSKLGIKVGGTITVEAAIRALVTKSANDVAAAVAEHISGTESAFARRMTATARRIGMTKSTFRNASGLPNDGQKTTARDMVTLGERITRDFPEQYKYFNTKSFSFQGRTYRNHNRLLRTYAGTDGIKTGYIRASGFNLLASVRRGDKHVIAVVFGGKTARRRDAHMRAILDAALPKAVAMKKPAPITPPPRAKPQLLVAAATRAAPATAPALSRATPAQADRVGLVQLTMVATPPRNRELPLAVPEARPSFATASATPLTSRLAAAPAPAAPQHAAPTSATRSRIAHGSAWRPGEVAAPEKSNARAPVTAAYAPVAPQDDPGDAIERLIAAAIASTTSSESGSAPESRLILPPAHASAGARTATVAALAPSEDEIDIPEGWQIQVGAYADYGDARDRLSAVKEAASDLLGSAKPYTQPVEKDSGTLYRARFAGLDKSAAERACRTLKKKKIDCFVTVE